MLIEIVLVPAESTAIVQDVCVSIPDDDTVTGLKLNAVNANAAEPETVYVPNEVSF